MERRSGFERTFEVNLKSRGIKYTYETLEVPYVLYKTYNPDWYVSEYGFYVETKGLLDRDSKAKMVAVKKQHPDLDIRFVFMYPDKKIPGTKQTHAQWADKNGYKWADGVIPEEWLDNDRRTDRGE